MPTAKEKERHPLHVRAQHSLLRKGLCDKSQVEFLEDWVTAPAWEFGVWPFWTHRLSSDILEISLAGSGLVTVAGASVFMLSVYDPQKGPALKLREISLGGHAAGMGFHGALEVKATKMSPGP